MRNLFAAVSFFTFFAMAGVAQARPCPPFAGKEIVNGLQSLSTNASKTEEERETANFVATLISNGGVLACDYNSGFAGSIYQLTTSTHQILINFVGGTITDLKVKRTQFN